MDKPTSKTNWTNNTSSNRQEPTEIKKDTGYIKDEKPGRKTLNWILWIIGQWIDYLENITDNHESTLVNYEDRISTAEIAIRQGITEWNTLTTYFIDDFVKIGNKVYVSKTDNNLNNNPISDNTNWAYIMSNDSIITDSIQVKTPYNNFTVKNSSGEIITIFTNDKTMQGTLEGTEKTIAESTITTATSQINFYNLLGDNDKRYILRYRIPINSTTPTLIMLLNGVASPSYRWQIINFGMSATGAYNNNGTSFEISKDVGSGILLTGTIEINCCPSQDMVTYELRGGFTGSPNQISYVGFGSIQRINLLGQLSSIILKAKDGSNIFGPYSWFELRAKR